MTNSPDAPAGSTPDAPAAAPTSQFAPPEFPAPAAPVKKKPSTGKKILTLVVFLVMVGVGGFLGTQLFKSLSGNDTAEGVDGFFYSAPSGAYTATFPGKPTETSQNQTVGDVELTLNSASYSTAKESYAVNETDIPADIAASTDIDTLLQNSADGVVANLPGSTLKDSEFSTLSGERSIEGHVEAQGATIFFEIAVVNDTQFVIVHAGGNDADSKKFAESFRFTK